MRKLLRADFARAKKSLAFWSGMIVMAGFGLLFTFSNYNRALEYELSFSELFTEIIFQITIMMGIVFAVFCSMFLGTEYDNGTIRNKLMIGQSRTSIYLSNFVCCLTAGIIQVVGADLIVFAVGSMLAGKLDISAEHFLQVAVVALFLCVAYMSIYNMFSMIIASKSHAETVNILLAFAFLMLAAWLFSSLGEPEMVNNWSYTPEGVLTAGDMVPNTNYISGTQREIFQFLAEFLPGGQNYMIANLGMHEALLKHPMQFCFYSAAVTVIMNTAGIFIFRRKDIK